MYCFIASIKFSVFALCFRNIKIAYPCSQGKMREALLILPLNRYTLILLYCNAFSSTLWLRESSLLFFFFLFFEAPHENTHNSLGSRLYWQIIGECAQREGTVFDIATDQRGRRLVEMERLSSMDKTVL